MTISAGDTKKSALETKGEIQFDDLPTTSAFSQALGSRD